jgi:hypothetical protein
VKSLKFIEPLYKNAEAVDWHISERVRNVVKYYSEYTEHTEADIVDAFLLNLLEDEKFLEWIKSRRSNKRIAQQLGIEHLIKEG